ncbi:hypothetical protein BJX61DRAFT_502073 [Aspergillus egyptiacus]|nr:hypothetical protein BJX61DRAFT_502073 [Aspergillus egyptiacus]
MSTLKSSSHETSRRRFSRSRALCNLLSVVITALRSLNCGSKITRCHSRRGDAHWSVSMTMLLSVPGSMTVTCPR